MSVLTVDGSDKISMMFVIQGKEYDVVLPKQRFEQTVDKLDSYITRGRDLAFVKSVMKDKIISIKPHKDLPKAVEAPAKKTKTTKKGKKSSKRGATGKIVAKFVKPGMSASAVANTVHEAHPEVSYAAAYYQASKLLKVK